MARIIEVVVSPTGETTVQTKGYAGSDCLQASRFLEEALRLATSGDGSRPDSAAGDPLAALRALPALADPGGTALLLVHNFHRFLANPEVVQTTFSQLVAGK